MIGLFCFDGPLYKDKNGIYCNVTLTDEMFKRYFCVVDSLIIIVRIFQCDKTYKELNMKPLTIDNIQVVEVENINTIKGFIFQKRLLESRIVKYVKRADLIFARMPSNISNSVLKMAKSFNKPYLTEVGGCAWDSYWNHGILGKIIAPLLYYREKKYVRYASYSSYVTKCFLQIRYPNKNTTTNCSNVYLQKMDKFIIDDRQSKIDNTDFSNIVIGQAVNSIDVKYKGEHLILKAMGKLKKIGVNVEYQIVGPGNGLFLKQKAKKYGVSNQLKLIGTMKKEEMFDWYRDIDIYIQPSRQEGLPRSVIEAMSSGCPSLGSNIAGIPELLDDDCLFNPNKNKEIVSCICNILNKEKMKEKAINNFERAKEYNIKDIEERRQNLFETYMKKVKKLYYEQTSCETEKT